MAIINMNKGDTVVVRTGSDEQMEELYRVAKERGAKVVDERGKKTRKKWLILIFWVLLTIYYFVASYCRFKTALGLVTYACGCTS